MDMILDRPMNMDSRTPSRPSTPVLSPQCQRRIFLNAEIQKFTFLAQGIESSLESIRRFGTVDENDAYVIKARTELQDWLTLLKPGELRNKFKNLIEEPTRISTETSASPRKPTQSQQPVKNLPPVMLKVQINYISQMKIITDKMPFVRGKLTGEYLKLYTDTFEQQRNLIHYLEELDYEFHVIPAKADRPIKIVIKGLPRDTPINNIQEELRGFVSHRKSFSTHRSYHQTTPPHFSSYPPP
ncbi:hypothetical protein TNIN_426081 [Trichonephila inaurata madagascariensis]|uniref:Uncharacterized protein n=1 Tax=Trichonephila inaurata madagascariensis TaxID=2747483 RepID=A0A8X6J2E0_9ARAC|nr:hypothetical protein TNIN_426081 [Trichonephila inaurata madagascariensis]